MKGLRQERRRERCGASKRLSGAQSPPVVPSPAVQREREFFIDNLLAQTHLIIVMISWTGLAPWDLNSLFRAACYLPCTRSGSVKYQAVSCNTLLSKTLHPITHYRTPYIVYSLLYTLHPIPNTLYPLPYTLYPTPNTEHPRPNTLDPTP